MATTLINAKVISPEETLEGATVVIGDDGRIAYLGAAEDAPQVEGPSYDLRGRLLVPGFIDIHVHGGHGVAFGQGEALKSDLEEYAQWVATRGITGFLLSIAAPDAESLAALIRQYAAIFKEGVQGAEPLGIHLEGPFLSLEKKGAFNPAWLRKPNLEEAQAYLDAGEGWIRQMTLAPELPGAKEVAALFRAHGIVVALGHTNAEYDLASAALRGDFTHVTHTFNAQRGFSHRAPGVFGAILASDGVTAELIADTVHVHPAAMKILIRCLGTDRVVLITDAMAAAGLHDGTYDLVGHKVIVREGHATLENGTIAGSTATLDQCVHNMNAIVGLPLPEAIKMATLNPARAMGFAERLGNLAIGKDASMAVIDEQAKVYMTFVKGQAVYNQL